MAIGLSRSRHALAVSISTGCDSLAISLSLIVLRYPGRSNAYGSYTGQQVHGRSQQERQPGGDAVQQTAHRATCHIDSRVTSLIETARLGIRANINDRLEHRIRRGTEEPVDRGFRHHDNEQYRENDSICHEEHRNRPPADDAYNRIHDDQDPAVMTVSECASEYGSRLLCNRGQRSQPTRRHSRTRQAEADQRNRQIP